MRNRRVGRPGSEQSRQLPHDLSAEQGVLGGVLLSNEALALLDYLEIEDFYDHKNKVVFAAMRNLEAAHKPIDVILLENEIAKSGKLEAIGGVAYLGELTLRTPTVDNVEWYARLVREKRITRQVMVMIGDVIDEAYDGGIEGEQLVHDVTTALLTIATGADRPIVTIASLVADEALRIEQDVAAKAAGKLVVSGIPTGITALDLRVGGHPISIPTLYIGRPAVGKTVVLLHVAEHALRMAGVETLFASYEDRGQSFGQRALAKASGIATDLLRARRISADDLISIAAGKVAAGDRQEMFLAAAGTSVEALVRRVRRENLRRRHAGKPPIGQLIVDYIQKMPLPEWARSKDDGIGHISNVLSAAAVDENMALVIACQLNREVEKRDDHRPRLSDIRDCGALEQDGKLILGLYRPWSYEPNKHPEEELHVLGLKNHNGESGFDVQQWWDVQRHAIYNTQTEYGAARNGLRTAVHEQKTLGDEYSKRFEDDTEWHLRR